MVARFRARRDAGATLVVARFVSRNTRLTGNVRIESAPVTKPSADGMCYGTGVSSDTKAIIGTSVGTGLVVAGLLSAQIAGLNTRVDDIRADLRDMRSSMERFDARLDAVEVALGKLDKRLLTIERVVLPSAAPDG